MKLRGNRFVYRWVIILSSSLLVLLAITISLTKYLEREILSAINAHHAEASSVDVNLFTRSLKIKNLKWNSEQDSLNSIPHVVRINSITVKGIRLYQLLVNKIICANQLTLDSAKVQYNTKIKHDVSKIITSQYSALQCHSIFLNAIETEIITDTIVSFSAMINLHLMEASVRIDSVNALQYSLKNSNGIISNISFNRHEGMYGSSIQQLVFNTEEQSITMDSILMIPNFSKFEFAHYLGDQAVRINISIPKLSLEGVAFDKLIDSTIIVSKIQVQSFNSYSFKDKRVPFLNVTHVPLPMAGFLNFGWKIKIDSILILNSRLTIEEFPEKGEDSGVLTIDDVNAVVTGLNNRKDVDDLPNAIVNVTGLLMNAGKLNLSFQFPLDDSSSYYAKGSVSKMHFAELNPVLTRLANLRIKSGYLNNLTFNFMYTEFASNGHLDIDYSDLHITSLNKNKQTTNDLRTLFVNAVVKNNRDQSGPTAKADGVINIERNRKKSIFNVLRMSILDGLRSSILGKNKAAGVTKKS